MPCSFDVTFVEAHYRSERERFCRFTSFAFLAFHFFSNHNPIPVYPCIPISSCVNLCLWEVLPDCSAQNEIICRQLNTRLQTGGNQSWYYTPIPTHIALDLPSIAQFYCSPKVQSSTDATSKTPKISLRFAAMNCCRLLSYTDCAREVKYRNSYKRTALTKPPCAHNMSNVFKHDACRNSDCRNN